MIHIEKDIEKRIEMIVSRADDKLAKDISVLKVTDLTPMSDYFIIMHASNERQLAAVVEEILDVVHEEEIPLKNVEGKKEGKWTLIDLYDIIVHVFHYSERATYNLENIWKDAPQLDISHWIQTP